MSTIRFNSLLPVRTQHEDMLAYCAQFGLTLISWEKSAHQLSATVEEDVSEEMKGQIAQALNAHMAANLITAIP